MNKSKEDVQQVIALGKPGAVIKSFLLDYLTGVALQPYFDAQTRYLELKSQPDMPDVAAILAEDGTVLYEAQTPNEDRDMEILSLEGQYPTLLTGEMPTPDLETCLPEGKEVLAGLPDKYFTNVLDSGICNLSLGWPINCRRNGRDNDMDNMERLLNRCVRAGLEDTALVPTPGIKGADDVFHDCTIADLRDVILPEMEDFGLQVYVNKWAKEEAIINASTLEELLAVID